MQRVLVNMQNFLMSEAIERILKGAGEFQVTVVEKVQEVTRRCNLMVPNILLMEVTGYAPWQFEDRMKIRDEIRQKDPTCKIVFLVDEKAEGQIADEVKQAKKDGLIDLFIYGSISASYLAALLETL